MILDAIVPELRLACRGLHKSIGFSTAAILTLALGIGASTAVFTVVDSVILKPLAYHDAGRLVCTWERVRFLGDDKNGPNPRHLDLWRQRSTAFEGLTLFGTRTGGLASGNDHPRRVGAVGCASNLFDLLEVPPLLGRTFHADDGKEGQEGVAVLTYPLWQSLFHGDPGAIGKMVRLDETPRKVVGVLPPSFQFPNVNALPPFGSRQATSEAPAPAIFYPVVFDYASYAWNGDYGNWVALGRLKPGFSVKQAEAQLNVISAEIAKQIPAKQSPGGPVLLSATVEPMQEAIVGNSRLGLGLLMAAVMGLLLIACLNLANAQLGRAMAHRRETAVRAALGAARWRIVWSSVAENLVLAAIGGTAGVLMAIAGLNFFRSSALVDLPRLAEVHLNWVVLSFAMAATLAASLMAGILPALRAQSADPQAALQQNSGRSLGGLHTTRLRGWLIGLQVFGCTALLLITGLFSKSLLLLLRQDKGFETSNVAIAEASLPRRLYGNAADRVKFDDTVLRNLRDTPGILSAGMGSSMPLEGEAWIEPLTRLDRPDVEGPLVNARWVSEGYFETTGQRLVAGRFFEERDRDADNAVISEGEAKALWRGENPIGSQIRLLGKVQTVIGVVADSRSTSLKTAPARMAYVHYKFRTPYTSYFVARRAAGTETVLTALRQAIWKYAPNANIGRVKMLDAQLRDSLGQERFQTMILTGFGLSALLLAMLGIYGVLSYAVETRQQEIGVRMALGATRAEIYSLTMGQAGAPVLGGLASGLVASALAGRLIRRLLFGVEVMDATVIVAVAAVFLLAAAAAAFLPARRAASVDPMAALRAE
jgi:predicted permease